MKRFHHTILIILFFTVPFTGFCQWIGLVGNLNYSDVTVHDPDRNLLYTAVPGYQTGITLEFRMVKLLSLESGLIFSSGGAFMESNLQTSNDNYAITANIRTSHLEIPLVTRFYVPVADHLALFAAGGMYGKRGIGGNVKYHENHNGIIHDKKAKVEWGNDPDIDDFKTNDMGLTAAIGVQYRFLQLAIQYDHGLADISPYAARGIQMHNRTFLVSVNYKLTRVTKLLMPFYEDNGEQYIYSRK
jgi:hypothetical protein